MRAVRLGFQVSIDRRTFWASLSGVWGLDEESDWRIGEDVEEVVFL
jgi:hypothetical protein